MECDLSDTTQMVDFPVTGDISRSSAVGAIILEGETSTDKAVIDKYLLSFIQNPDTLRNVIFIGTPIDRDVSTSFYLF